VGSLNRCYTRIGHTGSGVAQEKDQKRWVNEVGEYHKEGVGSNFVILVQATFIFYKQARACRSVGSEQKPILI
jgi:hypothetical protein